MKYDFPYSCKQASLEERQAFYYRDFRFSDALAWLGKFEPHAMSISLDLGVETGIIKESDLADQTFIRLGPMGDALLKETILRYLPEDVYYDRTLYHDPWKCHECEIRAAKGCLDCGAAIGQELVFDIDPENYWCPDCDAEREKRLFSFCEKCFQAAKEATLYLYEILEEDFSDLQIVFTGRGFHIHVLDANSIQLSGSERRHLIDEVKGAGIAIDSHVPDGRMHLIRLPYSLNGLVNRIATPLEFCELESMEIDDVVYIPTHQ